MGCGEPGAKPLASEWNMAETTAWGLRGAGKGSQAPCPWYSFVLAVHRDTGPAPRTICRFVIILRFLEFESIQILTHSNITSVFNSALCSFLSHLML